MSKIWNKENIKTVLVLSIICIVVAALMSAVNLLTEPVISDRNEKEIAESLGKVMPGGQFDNEPDTVGENAPETISRVYTEKTGMGTVVVIVTNKGYTGKEIGFTVGIDASGKITGMQITKNEESIVPAELKPKGTYGNHYVGAGAKDIAELVTGATVQVTEGAIKSALNDAFVYLGFVDSKPELPREESEIFEMAKDFYGEGAENLVSYTPKDSAYVKRVYKENGKDAYVAYAFVYSQYGHPEFEFLIRVDENRSVTDIKKIVWRVSDPKPEWGYNPPSDEAVDALFGSFVGKNVNTVSEVEIETGATNTAGRLRDAALEALKVNVRENEGPAARIIGITALVLALCGFAYYVIVLKKRRTAGK